jgi:hypothetical protein
MHARPILFVLAAAVAGCCGMCAETTQSENIRTEGMRAAARVESRGDGRTSVDITLRAGGPLSNLYPVVSGGDRIEASNGVETVPLVFSKNVIATPSYHGELKGDSGGRLVEVRFHRVGNTSALGTHVTMPPPFAITSPPGAKISAARPVLEVTWSPTGPMEVAWQVEGECIEAHDGHVDPDVGRLEVVLKAAARDGGALPRACDVKVQLSRQAHGKLDPAYGEGGSIVAIQERELKVEFIP